MLNLTKLFLTPIYCWKLFGPPFRQLKTFLAPLHFAQPPHQGIYEHSLMGTPISNYGVKVFYVTFAAANSGILKYNL